MVGVGWLPKFGFLVIGRRPILIDFIRFCKKCPNVLVLLEVFWKIICLRPSGFQCFLSYRSHNDHMVGDRHSRWRYFCRNRGGQCAEIADVPLENIFGFLIFCEFIQKLNGLVMAKGHELLKILWEFWKSVLFSYIFWKVLRFWS